MAHNYKVGDKVRITDTDDRRYGEMGTVIEVEPPEYDLYMPAYVEFDDGSATWPHVRWMERVITTSDALPETRYIEAALSVKNLSITAQEVAALLDLARKFEEVAR